MTNEFIVPTGHIIKEYLNAYGISEKEFANKLNLSNELISSLLKGTTKLSKETAIKLENVFPEIKASYWLNYEMKYREFIAKEFNESIDLDENKLIEYSKKFKFSTIFHGFDWDLRKQANEMLKLLRLKSFDQFDSVYSNFRVDFMEDGGETESIAIWLNLAREEVELQNKDLSDLEFEKEKFYQAIHLLKNLALNPDYENSINSARKFLNKFGIYLVMVDAIPNSKVRGALTTYQDSPAIYLSGRFKTHDHTWFALMHEIGHLIMHYNLNETIIDFEDETQLKDIPKREKEANSFARDFFINLDDYKYFITTKIDKKNIESFAKKQGVHPGIVVARLQHDQIIRFDQFSYLKGRKQK